MTYCVGLYLREGIVLLSDTRTNAGVDNISVFSKMQVEEVPGERVLTMLSAGNLAITQAVWNRLQEGVRFDGARHTLRTVRQHVPCGAAGRPGGTRRVHGGRRGAAGAGCPLRHLPDAGRTDRRRGAAAVPGLRRRQFHRGDGGHALPADRRAQIRQADPRPRGELRHADRRRREAGDDQHGQHAAVQPDRRHADRPAGLPHRRLRGDPAPPDHRGRRLFPRDPGGLEQRRCARPTWRCRGRTGCRDAACAAARVGHDPRPGNAPGKRPGPMP